MPAIASLLLTSVSDVVGKTFNVEAVDGSYQKWSYLDPADPITKTATVSLKRTNPSSYSNDSITRDRLISRQPGLDAEGTPYKKPFRAETVLDVPGWMTPAQRADHVERHIMALRNSLIEGQMRDGATIHG